MNDELARWVRGLGARTIDVTQDVEEKPMRVPQVPRQKKHLTVDDLPPESIRLEINGRPFYVVLRDAKVYMSYLSPSGTACIKRVKPHGAKEAALALARLVHRSGGEWPDHHVALACNWPNVVAPPPSLVALRKSARASRPPESDGVARAAFPTEMLPGDAVEVSLAHRTCYVLLEHDMVFMRMASWNASTAYLREVTDLARKKRIVAMAREGAVSDGRGHPFTGLR